MEMDARQFVSFKLITVALAVLLTNLQIVCLLEVIYSFQLTMSIKLLERIKGCSALKYLNLISS